MSKLLPNFLSIKKLGGGIAISALSLLATVPAQAWTVYFTNPKGWTTPAIYTWGASGTNNDPSKNWPGTSMTRVIEGVNLWKYESSEPTPTNLLFTDGASSNTNQTIDYDFVDETYFPTLYVVGSKVGDAGSWALKTNPMTYNTSNNNYEWTGNIGSGFKLNNGEWTSSSNNKPDNIGPTKVSGDNGPALQVGEPYSVINSDLAGNIVFESGTDVIENATISFSTTTMTITVTGTETQLPDIFGETITLVGLTSWDDVTAPNPTLSKTEEKIYSGTVEIDASTANVSFRIYTDVNNGWDAYCYGPTAEENNNVQVTFTNNEFEGDLVSGKGCWYFQEFKGEVKMTVDFNEPMNVVFEVVEEEEIPNPEAIYVVGNFNDWGTAIGDATYELTSAESNGIYTGKINIPNVENGDTEFKFAFGQTWLGPENNPVDITLESGIAQNLNLSTNSGENNYILKDWNGGEIDFTLNYNELAATIVWTAIVDEPGDEITWKTIEWGEGFNSSSTEDTYWMLPEDLNDDAYSGPIYIKSDYSVNLLENNNYLLYLDEEEERPADLVAVEDVDGTFVYTFADYNNYFPYYFSNLSDNSVKFTFYQGVFGDTDEEETYTFGNQVTLSIGEEAIFQSTEADDSPLGILTNATSEPYVKIEMRFEGMDPFVVEFEKVVTEEGYYGYNLSNVSPGTKYYISCASLESVTFTFKNTLIEGEVEEKTSYQPITLNSPFTANDENPAWAYEAEEDLGNVVLSSNSPINLLTSGLLVFTSGGGYDMNDAWTPVKTAEGYAYNGEINAGSTYEFTYNGSEDVVFTLSQGHAQPSYMSVQGQVAYDADLTNPVVYVYWNESLSQINGKELTAVLTVPVESEEPVQTEVTGVISTYAPDATDEPNAGGDSSAASDNAIMFQLAEVIGQFGAGEYTIAVSAGLVENNAGEWNNGVNTSFNVAAMPTESTVQPTIVISGDDITITWGDEAISEYNPYGGDVIITNNNDVDERLSFGNEVTISDNALVINIGELGLEEGQTYYLLVPEAFVYVGTNNQYSAGIFDYEFTAKASGINSLYNIEGVEGIYNLQGVKVQNPAKGGIYIINGKKVVIK